MTRTRFNLRTVLAVAVTAVLVVAAGTLWPASAQTISTNAKEAILIDAGTNTVLFEKNADELMPPASMSKLMTLAVVFDALKKGEISLDDTFFVSENAWRKGGASSGGSTMFAKLDSEIRVEDLLRGVIIQSGNDACIAIAENMAGTEEAFAARMTKFAREIGLEQSVFKNATGLPAEGHVMTARELAKLALYIINTYPDYYRFFGESEFTWNNITQKNRNPLLTMNIGADGLKTGYIEDAGYGLVGSAVQDGQRLVVVINGLDKRKDRGPEARKILTWGFRSFESVALFDASETVGHATVFGGLNRRVPLDGGGKPVTILRPRGSEGRLRARIVYTGPLVAPVMAGDQVARLAVSDGDAVIMEAPLYAAEDDPRGPLYRRAYDALFELAASLWYGDKSSE